MRRIQVIVVPMLSLATILSTGSAAAAAAAKNEVVGMQDDQGSTVDRQAASARQAVYRWFAALDAKADPEVFLAMLDPDDLLIQLPDTTLRGHGDFLAWYDGFRQGVASSEHTVRKIRVIRQDRKRDVVRLTVHWRATLADGTAIDQAFQHEWLLAHRTGGTVIRRMTVTPS